MDKLTPSAQRTLDALKTGPGNVHELAERTGRSRSTTDKAINDLAKAGLIVKVEDGGDPADGAPARWQLADPASADGDAAQPEQHGGDEAAEPEPDSAAEADPATPDDPATPEASPDDSPEQAADAQPADAGTSPDDGQARIVPDGEAADQGQPTSGGDAAPDAEATADGEKPAEAEPPKLCRGCQAQMPKICECCWQKTPAYCGTCRRNMPQVRRGEPGEPVILSNGLPKLRPGELEKLVEKVMRENPLPAFAGVTGWTGGRVAVHLPGRSTGAINNALEKLERTGIAELIGDKPMRYKLKDAEQSDPDSNGDAGSDGQDEAGQPAATTPVADAAESQPGTAA